MNPSKKVFDKNYIIDNFENLENQDKIFENILLENYCKINDSLKNKIKQMNKYNKDIKKYSDKIKDINKEIESISQGNQDVTGAMNELIIKKEEVEKQVKISEKQRLEMYSKINDSFKEAMEHMDKNNKYLKKKNDQLEDINNKIESINQCIQELSGVMNELIIKKEEIVIKMGGGSKKINK